MFFYLIFKLFTDVGLHKMIRSPHWIVAVVILFNRNMLCDKIHRVHSAFLSITGCFGKRFSRGLKY